MALREASPIFQAIDRTVHSSRVEVNVENRLCENRSKSKEGAVQRGAPACLRMRHDRVIVRLVSFGPDS
jgi:hypothetical protein